MNLNHFVFIVSSFVIFASCGKNTESFSNLHKVNHIELIVKTTPAMDVIIEQMQKRNIKLLPYYNNGAVGIMKDGLLTIRDSNGIKLQNRNLVKDLVIEENADLLELYRLVAIEYYHNESNKSIQEVKAIFAKKRIKKALQGWWYQNENNVWIQK